MPEFLYISAEETRALVGPDEALAVVEQVCRWHAAGEVAWPQPPVYALGGPALGASARIKAAALTAIPVLGVRVTSYYSGPGGQGSGAPDNTRFVLLTDPRTGRPLAIVDEHWTYNLRTCAAGVLALRHLADPAAATLGLVGAGQIAATCLTMLAGLFPLAEVRVSSRRAESRAAFARRLGEQLGLTVVPVATARAAVEGAALVVTCSSADQVLIWDGWLAPGATVCALGQWELHPEVYRTADTIVVSDLDVVREAPDMRGLFRDGVLSEERIWSDLVGLVTGRRPGRTDPEERIIIRASGLVSQDVALAHEVYKRAVRLGLGTRLSYG